MANFERIAKRGLIFTFVFFIIMAAIIVAVGSFLIFSDIKFTSSESDESAVVSKIIVLAIIYGVALLSGTVAVNCLKKANQYSRDKAAEREQINEEYEDKIDQRVCPNCGKSHDIDYCKCPDCNFDYIE